MTAPDDMPGKLSPEATGGRQIRQVAHLTGAGGRAYQAGRDIHVHHRDGVHGRSRSTGPVVEECPFPGLAAFGADQARWFFGRDRQVAELTGRLDERMVAGGPVVVVAPSGAGKSSLLHAGLLPALARGTLPGSSGWPRLVLTPTAHPLAALAEQIAASADPPPPGTDGAPAPVGVVPDLDGYLAALRNLGTRTDSDGQSGPPVLVVVDQFEELFALCTDEQERQAFVDLLSRIASPATGGRPAGLVVLGLRADFYTPCANYPLLRAALQDGQLFLGPLNEAELREAILYPAQDVGLDIEPGLVEVLLRDLGAVGVDHGGAAGGSADSGAYEAGRLPLLAHALRATWQQRHGHVLTVDGYRATGGIHHAVAMSAERIFDRLDAECHTAARLMFLRLINISDAARDTRKRASRTELLRVSRNPPGTATALDVFTRGRLLSAERDSVEITHEALLSAWPRLRQWIESDREGNIIRQRLEDDAASWDRNRRDNSVLYRGNRLEIARTWSATHPTQDYAVVAAAFLARSERHAQRAALLRRGVTALLAVLTIVSATTAGLALRKQHQAQTEQRIAAGRALVTAANAARNSDPHAALQLGAAAYQLLPDADTRNSLVNTLTSTPFAGNLTSPGSYVNAVSLTRDGRMLAAGGEQDRDRRGSVTLWDLTDRSDPHQLGQPLPADTSQVTTVAFSPDGSTLAAGSTDGHLILWDISDRSAPRRISQPLAGPPGGILSLTFAPDGHTIITGGAGNFFRTNSGYDSIITVWDAAGPAPHSISQLPVTPTGGVSSIAVTQDGHTIAVGTGSGLFALWDIADQHKPRLLDQQTIEFGRTVSLAIAPDGRTLAIGSADSGTTGTNGVVTLWDLTNTATPYLLGQPLTGPTNYVNSVAFSPDGRTLAAGSSDGTTRLWDNAP
jgi:hypothetical protein